MHLSNLKYFCSLFLFVLCFNSCTDKNNHNVKTDFTSSGIKVKINQAAGELYKAINFLPLPVNTANFKNIPSNQLECWVLSKRIKPGKKIDIDLFALIIYDDGNLKKNIIISTPTKKKYKTINTSDLMNFSTNHNGIKNILESWLKQYKGSKSSVKIQWKDKQEALRYLQKYTKQNKTNQ